MSLERVPISSIINGSNIPLKNTANTFAGTQIFDGILKKDQNTSSLTDRALVFATRYELASIPHVSQGHILEVLRGDLSTTNGEGTDNDGGWGLQFGPNGNPYLKMQTEAVSIGRTGGSLTVCGEDRTGAWTSYTPIISGSGGGAASGTTIEGRYKRYGKTCHCVITGDFSKNTLAGRVYFSLPYTSSTSGEPAVSGVLGVIGTTAATSYGYPTVNGGNLEFLAGIGVAGSWASLSASTLSVKASFTYETT